MLGKLTLSAEDALGSTMLASPIEGFDGGLIASARSTAVWRIRTWGPVPGLGAVWTVQELGFYITGCAETAFDTSEILSSGHAGVAEAARAADNDDATFWASLPAIGGTTPWLAIVAASTSAVRAVSCAKLKGEYAPTALLLEQLSTLTEDWEILA